jgi:hypothetical protein
MAGIIAIILIDNPDQIILKITIGTQIKLFTKNLFNRGCRPITALYRFMRLEFSITVFLLLATSSDLAKRAVLEFTHISVVKVCKIAFFGGAPSGLVLAASRM